MKQVLFRAISGLVFILSTTGLLRAQNWPQFLGPGAKMIVEAGNPPDNWGEQENIHWTYDMPGESWTSPVIWDDRIYISWAREIDSKGIEKREGDVGNKAYSWQVACIDLETGAELWNREARRSFPRIKKHAASNYACETPVTDGKRLYVYFGMHGLYCFSLEGEKIWEKDLGAYKTQMGWGTGSSPVLYKNSVIVQADSDEKSFLLGLDKHSGEELWRVDREENTNYSTPYIWTNRQRTELIVGGSTIRSYNPSSGELFWELAGAGKNTIPSAIGNADHLYVGNVGFMRTPASLFCVGAGASGDISPAAGDSTSSGVKWSMAEAPLGNPSPLLHEGLLYVVGSRKGLIHVYEADSGTLVYEAKVDGSAAVWSSPWIHGDKVFICDEKGLCTVIKTGRSFEILHQNKLDDKIWSSMAASGDSYLIKGLKKMYCIRNSEQAAL